MTGFYSLATGAVNLQCLLAAAEAGGEGADSSLKGLVFTLLPIVIIGLLIWFFFVRGVKGTQEKYAQYVQRHQQHMERVEQTLERIASVLEKNGPSDSGPRGGV
jgi:hypothetical protein